MNYLNINEVAIASNETNEINKRNKTNTNESISSSVKLVGSKKVIHILATGCVGSTYSGSTLFKHPDIFKYFIESFNTHYHGADKYRKPFYNELLQCFFLNICDDYHVRTRLKLWNDDDIHAMNHSAILFKTTQFQRFDILNESVFSKYAHSVNNYYIIFLIRDPRATWNSCKKFPLWAESDPKYLCDKYMKMRNELEVLRKHYKINIIGMYNEFVATLYPYQYREILFKFLKLRLNISIQQDLNKINQENEIFGDQNKRIYHSNRWINELNFTQIQMIQNIDSCSQWIKQFGYNFVENIHFKDSKDDILMTVEQMKRDRNPYPIHVSM